MALDFASDPLAELGAFRALGVDGVFVDCPSTAREWLAAAGLQRQGAKSAWLPYGLRVPGMQICPLKNLVLHLVMLLPLYEGRMLPVCKTIQSGARRNLPLGTSNRFLQGVNAG